MNPHKSTRIKHESDTSQQSQLDHEIIIVYRSLVGKVWELFDWT